MSFTQARKRIVEQRDEPADRDPRQCAAYGCPCRATVNLSGNGWACFAHAFAEVDKWQDITHGIQKHDWLLGLVSEVRKMDRASQNWRAFATRFWEQSDGFCVPDPLENASPYCDRMLLELLHRIGQLAKRPVPRLPRAVKPAGRFAREALKEVV